MWDEFDRITIIGDVHGKLDKYQQLLKKYEAPTIQVGDFGFEREHLWHEKFINPKYHRIVFGNHDYLPNIDKPHSFGDTSTFVWRDLKIMTIRGASSPDRALRTPGISWFYNEEISYVGWNSVIDTAKDFSPDIVISHTTPSSVSQTRWGYPGNTLTEQGLEAVLDCCKPILWLHGHYHVQYQQQYGKTIFIGLNECGAYSIGDPRNAQTKMGSLQ